MFFIIMNTLVLLLFSVMSLSHAVSNSPQTLVIIGDSLTEGYGVKDSESFPYLLQMKVQQEGKNWKIANEGISGSTTASAPSRVKWVLKKPPQIVILALGGNDALRGIDASATEKNLDQALGLLQEAKVKTILAGMKMPPNYKGQNRDKFENIFPKLAKKYHVKLIPFLLDGVAGNPALNQKDGIHPNPEGHKIMAEKLYSNLKTDLQ